MPRRNGPCQKCGTWRARLQRDHIIPKFEGGSDDPSNFQYLCANCHEDKTIDDMKRRRDSPETRAKRIASLTGRKHTPEHRAKIAASLSARYAEYGGAFTGKSHTPEAREKIAAAKRGAKNPNYGKKPWNWKGRDDAEGRGHDGSGNGAVDGASVGSIPVL